MRARETPVDNCQLRPLEDISGRRFLVMSLAALGALAAIIVLAVLLPGVAVRVGFAVGTFLSCFGTIDRWGRK